jgi:hypothetical protein
MGAVFVFKLVSITSTFCRHMKLRVCKSKAEHLLPPDFPAVGAAPCSSDHRVVISHHPSSEAISNKTA